MANPFTTAATAVSKLGTSTTCSQHRSGRSPSAVPSPKAIRPATAVAVANMGRKAPRARNAATNEVENRLRHAAEYLGAMLQHEAASNAAATGTQMDLDAQREASRLFERELLSFLGAARTAWNYVNQIADSAGCGEWLDDRLSGRIFRFHRELANQDTHDYQVTPGVNQKVRVEGYQGAPRLHEGSLHVPVTLNITCVDSVTFVYEPKNLEPDVSIARGSRGGIPDDWYYRARSPLL